MPLERGQVTIDVGGAHESTLECEPFEWPRSPWELLELRLSRDTGWASLPKSVVDSLNALYDGAHGNVERGLAGLIVQYLAGTGPLPFLVEDWRGNSGYGVFVPDDGLEFIEVHGAAAEDDLLGGGYWTATIRIIIVSPDGPSVEPTGETGSASESSSLVVL